MAYFGNNKQLNAAIAAKMKSKYSFEIGCSVVNTKIYRSILWR